MDKSQHKAPAKGRVSPMQMGRASPLSFSSRHRTRTPTEFRSRGLAAQSSDDEFTRKLRDFTRRNRRAKQSLEQKQRDRLASYGRRRSRSLSRYIYRPYDFSPNRTRRVTPYYSRYFGRSRGRRSDLLDLGRYSSPYRSSAATFSPSRGRTGRTLVPDSFRYSSRSPTPSRLFRSTNRDFSGSRPSTPTGQSLRPHTPTSYGRYQQPRYRPRSVSATRLTYGRSASYTRSRSVTPSGGYRQGRSQERSPMIVPSGYRTRSPSPAAWTGSQSRGRSDARQPEYRGRSASREYSTSPSYSSQAPSLQGLRDPRSSRQSGVQRRSEQQQRYEEFEGDSVSSSSTITASYKSKRGGQIQEQPRFQYKQESMRGVDSGSVQESRSQHVEVSGGSFEVEKTSFGELSLSAVQKAQIKSETRSSESSQMIKQQLKASNSVHLAGTASKSSKKVVSKQSSSSVASSAEVTKTSEQQKAIPTSAKKLLKNFYRTVSSEKLLKDAKAGKLDDVDPEEIRSRVMSITKDDDEESVASVESRASRSRKTAKAAKQASSKKSVKTVKKSASKSVKSSVSSAKAVSGESEISTSERPDTLALKNKAASVDDATRQAHHESPLVDSRERTRTNTSSQARSDIKRSELQRRSRSNTKSRSPAEEEYFTARSGSEVGDNTSEFDTEEDMSSLHERKKLLASTFGESKFTKSEASSSSTRVSQSVTKTSKSSSKFSSQEESSTSVRSTKSVEIKSSKTSSSKFESSSVKLQKSAAGKFSIKQDETSAETSKTGKLKIKKKPRPKMPAPEVTGAAALQQAKEALLKRKQKKKTAKKEKAETVIEHAKLKHVHQKRGSDASSVDINVNLKPIPQKQITETKSEAKETASAVKVEQVRAETKISATESAQVSAVPKIR